MDFFVRYANQEVKAQIQAKLDQLKTYNKYFKMELKDISLMKMRALVKGYTTKNVNVHATPKRVENTVNEYYPRPLNNWSNNVDEEDIDKWSATLLVIAFFIRNHFNHFKSLQTRKGFELSSSNTRYH